MFKLTSGQIRILSELAQDHTRDQVFIDWHQEQTKSSNDFKKILTERDFSTEGKLALDEIYELGRLLSIGFGSTVLGMRGRYSPFEANDVDSFNIFRSLLFTVHPSRNPNIKSSRSAFC